MNKYKSSFDKKMSSREAAGRFFDLWLSIDKDDEISREQLKDAYRTVLKDIFARENKELSGWCA